MVDLVDQAGGPEAETEDTDALGASDEEGDEHVPGEPVYTKTLAELYVKQGAIGQAIEVYRHLGKLNPADEGIPRRIEELESGAVVDEDGPGVLSDDLEEEVETLARELAEHGDQPDHHVDSPFAIDEPPDETSAESEAEDTGPTIEDYFEGLLGWKSEKRS
jgi:hypothetical protein